MRRPAGWRGGAVARVADRIAAPLPGAESRSGERVWLKKRSANHFFRKGAGRKNTTANEAARPETGLSGCRATKKGRSRDESKKRFWNVFGG